MAFVGEYELIEKENYDEYLKIVGVKLLDRKVERSVMTRIHITNDGSLNFRLVKNFSLNISIVLKLFAKCHCCLIINCNKVCEIAMEMGSISFGRLVKTACLKCWIALIKLL